MEAIGSRVMLQPKLTLRFRTWRMMRRNGPVGSMTPRWQPERLQREDVTQRVKGVVRSISERLTGAVFAGAGTVTRCAPTPSRSKTLPSIAMPRIRRALSATGWIARLVSRARGEAIWRSIMLR